MQTLIRPGQSLAQMSRCLLLSAEATLQIAGFSGEESTVTDALLGRLTGFRGRSVVFSEYVGLLSHVAAALLAAGREAYVVSGTTPPKDRVASLTAWCSSPGAVLLGTKVLEVGLNLQAAGQLFSLGSSWNPAREIQRVGRIRRIGSEFATVNHTYLLADLKLERTRWKATDANMETGERNHGPRAGIAEPHLLTGPPRRYGQVSWPKSLSEVVPD